jgi:hypothetical protein
MFRVLFGVFKWFFRWLCLAALLCVAVAVVRTGVGPLRNPEVWEHLLSSRMLWVGAAGWGVRFALTRWRKQDPFEFLDTLEHELTHALTGYLTLAPPTSLTVTLREGGEVELPRANPLAALSPYFLPLFAGLIALLTLVLEPKFLLYGQFAVAFLLGGFVYRFFREFHLGQSDFSHYGILFSIGFIAALLPLSIAGVLEAARLGHLPWRQAIGPLFMEQGRWLYQAAAGAFHTLRAHL